MAARTKESRDVGREEAGVGALATQEKAREEDVQHRDTRLGSSCRRSSVWRAGKHPD